MSEMLMVMNVCTCACVYHVYLIIYAHQIITFGWLRNYGAKISKMHTVGVGVLCL